MDSAPTVSKTWSRRDIFGIANKARSFTPACSENICFCDIRLQQTTVVRRDRRHSMKTITVEAVTTYAGCRRFALMIRHCDRFTSKRGSEVEANNNPAECFAKRLGKRHQKIAFAASASAAVSLIAIAQAQPKQSNGVIAGEVVQVACARSSRPKASRPVRLEKSTQQPTLIRRRCVLERDGRHQSSASHCARNPDSCTIWHR
jgi:hypothetical protein